VIPDVDIWRAALLMTKRYDADAMLEAAARADQRLEDGDPAGAAIWYRILDAVEGGEGAYAAHGYIPSSANTAMEIAIMISATMANTGGDTSSERG
jgi:hypothetical protein